MNDNKKFDLKNYNVDELSMYNTWIEEDPDNVKEKINNKIRVMLNNEQWKVYNL